MGAPCPEEPGDIADVVAQRRTNAIESLGRDTRSPEIRERDDRLTETAALEAMG